MYILTVFDNQLEFFFCIFFFEVDKGKFTGVVNLEG